MLKEGLVDAVEAERLWVEEEGGHHLHQATKARRLQCEAHVSNDISFIKSLSEVRGHDEVVAEGQGSVLGVHLELEE